MGVHRLLGMRLGVPDPTGLQAFYDEVGLRHDGNGTFTGTEDGPLITVDEAPFRRLLSVAIGADDEATIAATAQRLANLGLAVDESTDHLEVIDPATRVAFSLDVARPRQPAQTEATLQPSENGPDLISRRNQRSPGASGMARPPRRLGHIVIGSPDLAGTRDLLVDGLGLRVSDQLEGVIAFLRCSNDHHNVAVVSSPVPMLQHYSWECDDVDHVGHTATALLRTDPNRHAWGFGRHFVGSNYFWYLRDPSGSFIEFYSDMDVIDDEATWTAAAWGDHQLDADGRAPESTFAFEHVANAWGPNMPAEFVAPVDLDEMANGWAQLER